MNEKKITYTEALSELEKILNELENNSETNMEIIAQKVKTAVELIAICKNNLRKIDEDLELMLQKLND
ncbi:MAG: exodeoxyribonuclease VII small subunit [Paludibacter sp.]|jgi:exodeoxyribonuclease VII small subunit|nr:exodeoxyribonuclease VII small subunit [Paludibacter sp.]